MSSTPTEIGGDKQTIEGSLNTIHSRLKGYTIDQITILDDIISTIESFYKTEKHTHEKMQGSLQKSLEHAQGMSYLGPSVIGSSWTTAIRELLEHYAERQASYPILKEVILENLRKIKTEKVEERIKVLLYDDEMTKEMVDVERRTIKSRRAYDDACERVRQHLNPVKEKESGIKRLHQKILPKTELERLEMTVVECRNAYILHVNQINYALKFYVEQYIVDLDKLLVCDLFPQIEQTLGDLVYSEYKRLHDILLRAIHIAVEDGEEQKKRLLPKTFQNYPLILAPDHTDQINTDDKYLTQLSSIYLSLINDVRDADQQIQLALESSVLNAQQNKDSRLDPGKIRLKRMDMRKSVATFIIETIETLAPNIKSIAASGRNSSKLISGLKPFISSSKTETNSNHLSNSSNDSTTISSSVHELDSSQQIYSQIPSYPCQAIVLYDFEGTNEDEMSVRKDDKIFIESKPEYDGWLVAKGRERSGLVPEAYVQLIPPIPTAPTEQNKTKTTSLGNIFDSTLRKKKKRSTDKTTVTTTTSILAVDEQTDEFSDE